MNLSEQMARARVSDRLKQAERMARDHRLQAASEPETRRHHSRSRWSRQPAAETLAVEL